MNTALVDQGDLSEALQSANAWASVLRHRAGATRHEFGALPIADELVAQYTAAADRIDQAVHRLRAQSHDIGQSLLAQIDDAYDLDGMDVLADKIDDTWETREYAAAIATLVVAVLDKQDPGDLLHLLSEKFGYRGGHYQPHPEPVRQ